MDYKLYKIHHSRGKSDTNFYQEQTILNGAYSSLKVLRVSIVSDLTSTSYRKNKKRLSKQAIEANKSNSESEEEKEKGESCSDKMLTLIERVLLFKQELDEYFFGNKIHLLKFHLNNISSIMIKHISNMQKELITAYPILKTSNVYRILNNFADIMSTFKETKPQDFYREIKDTILDAWGKNRIQINELFEKIEKYCNVDKNKEEQKVKDKEIDEFNFFIAHYELYNDEDKDDKNKDEISEESVKKLQEKLPMAVNYVLKRKKDIMNFITYMTQGILFSISRLFYKMDYYSIIISSLAFKIYYAIMHYVDSNKDKKSNISPQIKKKQLKVFHFMNHVIYLTYLYHRNKTTNKIPLYNGGLNSLSKYLLNNFIEIVSKCTLLEVPDIVPKFKKESLFQIRYKTKFYKCYPQRYKKYTDNCLLRIFMLYYNSKMTFWKSILIVPKTKDSKITITCRTCEKEIFLDDIFIHFGCCKEQQSFYDKMKLFKLKLTKYITNLEIYLTKMKINVLNPNNRTLFNAEWYVNNIMKKIPGFENDENGILFVENLKKLYNYEKEKSSDYYEKSPDNIYYIVSMSYFSIMFFMLNKLYKETDHELNEIIGGVFCTFLQIFMNVNFLLYVKNSKTKNNMIKFGKNKLNNYIYNSQKEALGDKYALSDTTKTDNQKSERIQNEELLKSDLNIKQKIQRYKLKLSVNNMFLLNNSLNLPRSNTNVPINSNNKDFVTRNDKKTKTVQIGKNRKNKKVQAKNLDNKIFKKIVSVFDSENNSEKDDHHTAISAGKNLQNGLKTKIFQNLKSSSKRNFSHEKYNIHIYSKMNEYNINKKRRNSCSYKHFIYNEQAMMNILIQNQSKNSSKNSSAYSGISNSEYSQDSVSSNLSIVESDTHNTHGQTPSSSRLNSTERTNDDSHNYFLTTNNDNFNLDYKGDKGDYSSKRINHVKLSLFGQNLNEKNNEDKISKDNTSSKQNEEIKNTNENEHKINIIDHNNIPKDFKSQDGDGDNILVSSSDDEEKNKSNQINDNSKDNIEKNNIEENVGDISPCSHKISKDIKRIFTDMLDNEKYNINVEQIASIFTELLEELKENDVNKNNSTKNKEEKRNSILKLKRKKTLDKKSSNKSVKFIDKPTTKIKSLKTINGNINLGLNETNKNENQKRITKFKLILPIAKGGYGVVGLYKNVKTNDIYAIKTVDIKSMKEKHLSNTLKNERDILKQIDSQYLVNSYFIFKDKKNYYFVMEYLPGGDVYTLLSKNNLPKKTIQLIIAETILAVNYLHNIHIIHHDIKPENILITPKGHFKLSDFGLSKTLEDDDSDSQVDKNLKSFVEFNKIFINLGDDEEENKEAKGTLNYMAPELFTEKYPQGGGVDYWAIGVLIFDLFSFSLPFDVPKQEELRNNIININIDWNKLINDNIKKIYGNINSAVDLIKKFLKENPKDRWGDKNLNEIKNHEFFEGFNWNDIENIKNDTIKEYVKKRTIENNNKIKKRIKEEKNNNIDNNNEEIKTEDGYPIEIEINLTENEEKYFFTERYDNLNKKNNEYIKKKIEKEANLKENISDLMLIDLE